MRQGEIVSTVRTAHRTRLKRRVQRHREHSLREQEGLGLEARQPLKFLSASRRRSANDAKHDVSCERLRQLAGEL